MKRDLRRAYIALAIVSFFWGTTYLASKISALHIPGFFVAGVRQFISGLILVVYFKAIGFKWPDKKSLTYITIQGVLLLCISNGLFTWALEYIPSGLAAIIGGLMPLFVALFSVLFLRFAKFTLWMVVGLLVGFGGIATIFYEHLQDLIDAKFALGICLSLTAVISWSFGTVYASQHKPTIHLLFSVGLQMLIAGIIMLTISGFSGNYINLVNANTDALLSLLYLIIIGSLLTYSAYVFAVSKLPPTQVSIYAFINPIVAIVLGWLWLHEKITINVITGTLITLAGVYLVNREFKKQSHAIQ